ncbi:MAG: hypothetical protein AABY22_12830, partial [Nanoarchaeota archaeon]
KNRIATLICKNHGIFNIGVSTFLNAGVNCQLCSRHKLKTYRATPIGCFEKIDDVKPTSVFLNIQEALSSCSFNKKPAMVSVYRHIYKIKHKKYLGFFWRKISYNDFIKYKLNFNARMADFLNFEYEYEGFLKKHKLSIFDLPKLISL